MIFFEEDLKEIDLLAGGAAIRNYLSDDFLGRTQSPPRVKTELGSDVLVHTIGGDERVFGFRAYTFGEVQAPSPDEQVVACWDRKTHRLIGLAIGEALGAWRTGLLGAVARTVLAPWEAGTCSVLGTGRQAMTQARATAALSPADPADRGPTSMVNDSTSSYAIVSRNA